MEERMHSFCLISNEKNQTKWTVQEDNLSCIEKIYKQIYEYDVSEGYCSLFA